MHEKMFLELVMYFNTLLKAFVVLSGVTLRLKRLLVTYLIGIYSSIRSCFTPEEAQTAPCLSNDTPLVLVQAQKGTQ